MNVGLRYLLVVLMTLSMTCSTVNADETKAAAAENADKPSEQSNNNEKTTIKKRLFFLSKLLKKQ